MGFWNDGIRPTSRPTSRAKPRSNSRSRSRSSSRSNTRTHRTASRASQSKHYSPRASFSRSASSFFGLDNNNNNTRPRASGSVASGRSRSYTSARPRNGFVARVRKFLRQIWEYMRKHPLKVFVLVIMPLITGGVLTKLLGAVGLRLPASLQKFAGSSMSREGGERYYARGGARDVGGGTALPGMGGGVGEAVQGALTIAKMFM